MSVTAKKMLEVTCDEMQVLLPYVESEYINRVRHLNFFNPTKGKQ